MPGLHLLASCRRIFRASGSAGMRLHQTGRTSCHTARSCSLQVPWQSLPGLDAGLEHAARAEYELGVQANVRKFLGRCNLKPDALRVQLRMPLAAALPSLACMQCRHSMLRRSSSVFAGFVSASLQGPSRPSDTQVAERL